MGMLEWHTTAVSPTSGTWVNVWQWGDGSVTTETVPAILTQEAVDGGRETRTQFGTQIDALAGQVRAVADVAADGGITHRYTVPADQVDEKLAAIESEAVGGNGQHERAMLAICRVTHMTQRGGTPSNADVATALACGCPECPSSVELAGWLDRLGLLGSE